MHGSRQLLVFCTLLTSHLWSCVIPQIVTAFPDSTAYREFFYCQSSTKSKCCTFMSWTLEWKRTQMPLNGSYWTINTWSLHLSLEQFCFSSISCMRHHSVKGYAVNKLFKKEILASIDAFRGCLLVVLFGNGNQNCLTKTNEQVHC